MRQIKITIDSKIQDIEAVDKFARKLLDSIEEIQFDGLDVDIHIPVDPEHGIPTYEMIAIFQSQVPEDENNNDITLSKWAEMKD